MKTTISKWLPFIILGVVIIGFGIYKYISRAPSIDAGAISTEPAPDMRFTAKNYGFAYTIPGDYVQLEGEKGTPAQTHYAYIMVNRKDVKPVQNGEGPRTISIDVLGNPKKLTLDQWFKTSTTSNSNLAKAPYATTTVFGKDAIVYKWSGLYEGETIAFIHKENIVMMSVTYLTPEDRNISAFKSIVASLELQ
jgi:hypothetical protein